SGNEFVSLPFGTTGMYLETRYIPTMIDFGRSQVTYNGKVYTNSIHESKKDLIANSAKDVYRLMADILAVMYDIGNYEAFDYFGDLLLIFPHVPKTVEDRRLYFGEGFKPRLKGRSKKVQTPDFLERYWASIYRSYDLGRFIHDFDAIPLGIPVFDCSKTVCVNYTELDELLR
ncbi:MAG: hypothetical protein ACMG6E_10435, partial [Candidatus Roizmanbacteria bacterium]